MSEKGEPPIPCYNCGEPGYMCSDGHARHGVEICDCIDPQVYVDDAPEELVATGMFEGHTTFQVSFTLKRDNKYKARDIDEGVYHEFSPKFIEDEIISWLEGLDYEVEDVKIDPAKDYSEDLRNLFIAKKERGDWGQIGLPHDWCEASALEYIKECEEKGIDPLKDFNEDEDTCEDCGGQMTPEHPTYAPDGPDNGNCSCHEVVEDEFRKAFDHVNAYLDAVSDGRSAEDFDDDDDDESWRMSAEANDAWKVLKHQIDDLWRDGDLIDDSEDLVIKWSVNDVLVGCPWLSPPQAKAVLLLARRSHNPEIGISWGVLEDFADILYPDRNGGDE